uniref:Uncharacterized protein n=1 Tax=Emiliania huxleyi TaxID=2903 RepID=A0A7S3T379_EMIHU
MRSSEAVGRVWRQARRAIDSGHHLRDAAYSAAKAAFYADLRQNETEAVEQCGDPGDGAADAAAARDCRLRHVCAALSTQAPASQLVYEHWRRRWEGPSTPCGACSGLRSGALRASRSQRVEGRAVAGSEFAPGVV